MEVYSFKKEAGRRITQFDSNFVMARIAKTHSEAHMGLMFLESGETVGFHQATVSQLFLVIEGECRVRAGEEPPMTLKTGEAVVWNAGEWHGTTTDNGVTALVIESEELHPFDLGEIGQRAERSFHLSFSGRKEGERQ